MMNLQSWFEFFKHFSDILGSFIESKVFDTHASTLSVINMKNYIKNIPDGCVIIISFFLMAILCRVYDEDRNTVYLISKK